jgi:hypothetical protein
MTSRYRILERMTSSAASRVSLITRLHAQRPFSIGKVVSTAGFLLILHESTQIW